MGTVSATCAYCEYFDGGGARKVEHARETGEVLHGDCLCSWGAPNFETTSVLTCDFFFRDSMLPAEPKPHRDLSVAETDRFLDRLE